MIETCRRCGGTALDETPQHPFLLVTELDMPDAPPARVEVANIGTCRHCLERLATVLVAFYDPRGFAERSLRALQAQGQAPPPA